MTRQIDLIPTPEEKPAFKGIAWWIENTLIRVAKGVFNGIANQMRQVFSFSISDAFEDMERELIDLIRPFANKILSMPNLPDYARTPIERAMSGTAPAGIIIIGAMVGLLIAIIQGGIIGPVSRNLEHQGERVFRSHLIDPGTAILMLQRGIISQSDYNEVMAMNGVQNDVIPSYTKLGKPLSDDTTLTQLHWRKEIGLTQLKTELSQRGFSALQIDRWVSIRELIPSPNELISIAVREGFNDSVAARFGYDEDYPAEAADWAEKQGMSQRFFKAAWRAHWTLPGLVQVREMYHRNIVNEGDLRIYLKAADFPIFWRDSIIKWMDRVVTRVDARRMYDLGIWDEARVFQHHKELGYSDKDAEDLTMWVALNYVSEDRDLTKSDILTMYQDGILNETEASGYLKALDYKPQAISLLLVHRDLKRDEAYERQVISNVKALFIGGLYDRTDVFAKLGKLATPDTVIKQSLAVWDLEKERKVAVPSSTQLRDMVLNEVIPVGTFITEMQNKKYPDRYINWYVKLWFGE